jgi:hypothetical protein
VCERACARMCVYTMFVSFLVCVCVRACIRCVYFCAFVRVYVLFVSVCIRCLYHRACECVCVNVFLCICVCVNDSRSPPPLYALLVLHSALALHSTHSLFIYVCRSFLLLSLSTLCRTLTRALCSPSRSRCCSTLHSCSPLSLLPSFCPRITLAPRFRPHSCCHLHTGLGHVRMYVCVYLCACCPHQGLICVWAYMCVGVYVCGPRPGLNVNVFCVFRCIFSPRCVCMCACTCVVLDKARVYVCVCVCTFSFRPWRVYVCVSVCFPHSGLCVYVHVYIYARLHAGMFVCVCVCT